MKFLYLLIDLLSIAVPLKLTFDEKVGFRPHLRAVIPAIGISALLFALWDELFTRWGVWGFNPRYLTGLFIASLPLEELLFFICIPYSCLFLYFLVKEGFKFSLSPVLCRALSTLLLLALGVGGAIFRDRAYTVSTFLLTAVFLLWHQFIAQREYFKYVYPTFGIVLLPFFLVNGILTGSFIPEEVVWYNDAENLGIRMGTIPFEDIFYGFLLVLLNITLYEVFLLKDRARGRK
jgi:lycopene cyclase domain-containing protein